MQSIKDRTENRDWQDITEELHDKGFVIVKNMLSAKECNAFIADYNADGLYRKTVDMDRNGYGKGEYKYYQYPLPEIITQLRENVYPKIVPVANQWMQELGLENRYPLTHQEMKQLCHDKGQTKPTALILKYSTGGFNTMHQDLYGDVYFPMQMVFMLNEIHQDYEGGEFVITEQIPRGQSKANVITPQLGDMVIFTTNFRPVKGPKRYHRVNMKHGISPLLSGARSSLGIIFHDALS